MIGVGLVWSRRRRGLKAGDRAGKGAINGARSVSQRLHVRKMLGLLDLMRSMAQVGEGEKRVDAISLADGGAFLGQMVRECIQSPLGVDFSATEQRSGQKRSCSLARE